MGFFVILRSMDAMRFFTEIDLGMAPFKLDAQRGLVLLGSCFSDSMGERLAACGVPVCANPGGTLYNPLSIAAVAEAALEGELPEEAEFLYEGRWRTWLMSTRLSAPDREEARALQREAISVLHNALLSAQAAVFTFGTAWVYEHHPSPLSPWEWTVANCHKVPAREFRRRRLSVAEITDRWQPLLHRLAELNPSLRIIFTVSPIRHFKDGARENTLSKAVLHLATHELTYTGPGSDYFPAWELLMDQLRDYRFYARDMLHPSEQAADFIFARFAGHYFSEPLRPVHAAHRPILT